MITRPGLGADWVTLILWRSNISQQPGLDYRMRVARNAYKNIPHQTCNIEIDVFMPMAIATQVESRAVSGYAVQTACDNVTVRPSSARYRLAQ